MTPEEMGGAIAEEARNAYPPRTYDELAEYAERMIVEAIDMARSEARELVAQFMIKHSFATGHGNTIEDLLAELGWQLIGAKPVSD